MSNAILGLHRKCLCRPKGSEQLSRQGKQQFSEPHTTDPRRRLSFHTSYPLHEEDNNLGNPMP